MAHKLAQDIDIAHRRRWPGRRATSASRLWLLANSAGSWLLLMHRAAHWLHARRAASGRPVWGWTLLAIALAPTKWAIQISAKSDIANDSNIDPGVCFSDQGHIIFGAETTGAGTVIGPRVTVGMGLDARRPAIGRNVWIGADCVVYGAISIGDGATLLPGTVLTKSIPARVVMQGNPARVLRRDFDNAALREQPELDALRHVLEAT